MLMHAGLFLQLHSLGYASEWAGEADAIHIMALFAQLDVARQEVRQLQAELQARDLELQAVVSRPSSSEAHLRVRHAFDIGSPCTVC